MTSRSLDSRRVACLGVLVLTAGLLDGERNEMHTGGVMNGRAWTALTAGDKLSYLFGYADHWQVATAFENVHRYADHGITDSEEGWFPLSLPWTDIAKGVDRFYQEPENLRFPIRI